MRGALILFVAVMLSGCLSVYKEPEGTFIVTKHSEARSPFGTNGGFDIPERCDGPNKKVMFYFESDFANCKVLKYDDPVYLVMYHKQSQGQGGQIVEGLAGGAGLGAVAATRAGGNAAASASVTAVNAVSVVTKGGHHK